MICLQYEEKAKKVYYMFVKTKKWTFYPQCRFEPRGDCSIDTKDINLEILHFKQFYKHFVFDKDEEGYVKKTQKNYMDVEQFCNWYEETQRKK